MDTTSPDNRRATEELGSRFRDQCFIRGESLLTGRPLWTPDNFDELHRHFTLQPDASSRKFDDKIAIQLADTSSEARHLFAELYLLDLTVLSNVRPDTKIRKARAILEECHPPVDIPDDVVDLINRGGVLHGGQGYSAYRYRHFWFLIELGMTLTRKTEKQREEALSPAHLETTIFTSTEQQDPAIQQALCYLFNPAEFPPITSSTHHTQIIRHFGPDFLPAGMTEASDFRKAGAILAAIRADKGPDWSFYHNPDVWKKKRATAPTPVDNTAVKPADSDDPDIFVLPTFSPQAGATLNVSPTWLDRTWRLLNEKKQLIFAGPPGTGKTYLAKGLAKDIADTDAQMKLIQFHPSYGYEDFFEGFRPSASDGGTISLQLKKGPLRDMIDRANEEPEHPFFLVIDEINRGNLARIFGELYFLLEYRTETVDLMYSGASISLPPNLFILGTMNTADRSIALVDAAIRRRFAFLELHPDEEPTSTLLTRWCAEQGVELPLPTLWEHLNDSLQQHGVDRNMLIGPSYFINPSRIDLPGTRLTWDTEILPLLHDIFLDQHAWVTDTFSFDRMIQRVETPSSP